MIFCNSFNAKSKAYHHFMSMCETSTFEQVNVCLYIKMPLEAFVHLTRYCFFSNQRNFFLWFCLIIHMYQFVEQLSPLIEVKYDWFYFSFDLHSHNKAIIFVIFLIEPILNNEISVTETPIICQNLFSFLYVCRSYVFKINVRNNITWLLF